MEDRPLCTESIEPGWTCAVHSLLPWKHDGCGWEGGPCPVCNPHGFVQWKEVYPTTDAERDEQRTEH